MYYVIKFSDGDYVNEDYENGGVLNFYKAKEDEGRPRTKYGNLETAIKSFDIINNCEINYDESILEVNTEGIVNEIMEVDENGNERIALSVVEYGENSNYDEVIIIVSLNREMEECQLVFSKMDNNYIDLNLNDSLIINITESPKLIEKLCEINRQVAKILDVDNISELDRPYIYKTKKTED